MLLHAFGKSIVINFLGFILEGSTQLVRIIGYIRKITLIWKILTFMWLHFTSLLLLSWLWVMVTLLLTPLWSVSSVFFSCSRVWFLFLMLLGPSLQSFKIQIRQNIYLDKSLKLYKKSRMNMILSKNCISKLWRLYNMDRSKLTLKGQYRYLWGNCQPS